MKIKVNRNILWAETFIRELAAIGVKYACVSPGSRNTPLTLAVANNKKIKSFVHIDERSCAFFALGLAKASESPVVVICTSGTATAELYPAIIEAYQQRIPLIICTADRPPELLDRGANQTINQKNLYKNHIRWFIDVGLPEPILSRIKHIKTMAGRAVYESSIHSRGPVHLNFPFRKPFEPKSYTDQVNEDVIRLSENVMIYGKEFLKDEEKNIITEKWFTEFFKKIKSKRKGLIIAGPGDYNPLFHQKCSELSLKLGYPVLADGASQLRFGCYNKENIITNFEGFLRSDCFTSVNKPDIIIHFGRTITSKALDQYLKNCDAVRVMINEYGDWFDPSSKSSAAFACKPHLFCEKMIEITEHEKLKLNGAEWLNIFKRADKIAGELKDKIISRSLFPNECRIINEIINLVPDEVQVMISNSMPVRDFDYFASVSEKNIKIYNNRGASGIDGITSTALGIAAVNSSPTVLLTGDLAFYYDLNGLLAANKYSIPLIIILINNNGGGIFEVLPVSGYGKIFKDFFIASHDLDFSGFVKAYKGNYSLIKSWQHLKKSFNDALKRQNFTVLEVQTDAVKSLSLRRKFWADVDKNVSSLL